MAKKWSALRAKMGPERLSKIEARVKETLREMPLQELRNARQMTQTNLAQILEVQQGEISKIEKRTDMYISTLRSYVEAMGGTLELRAVFPDGSVVIQSLGALAEQQREGIVQSSDLQLATRAGAGRTTVAPLRSVAVGGFFAKARRT